MIAEDSAVGLCNLTCITSTLCIIFFLTQHETRLTVKPIVVGIGMVVTVRDPCTYERMSRIRLGTSSSTTSSAWTAS